MTTMLPTKVPLFREIIIMHLQCDDCNFRNSEVSFGGEIQELGKKITFQLTSPADLDRQLIKSDSATLSVPSIELEIPPYTQRGTITTIEGFLKTAASNLERDQPERLRIGDVENFHRCRAVIQKLLTLAGSPPPNLDDDDDNNNTVFEPFELVLDDTAGNSFIENPNAPTPDPHLVTTNYIRTPTQDMSLGLQPSQSAREAGTIDDSNPAHKNIANVSSSGNNHKLDLDDKLPQQSIGRQEALRFPTPCPHCREPSETDMCITDIPHFKEVIIMSLCCEKCGYKSNEVKGGGSIPKYGTTITLRITCPDDLEREVLKSDTSGITIPELEMELAEGGLDGLYTTVEGLMNKLYTRLEQANPFGSGDAATKQHRDNDAENGVFSKPSGTHVRYMAFLDRLKNMASGNILPFTLIIIDPLSNSFVGPIPKDSMQLSLQAEKDGNRDCYENYVDPGMEIEEFERNQEQNDDLGISDMKTENYQEDTVDGDDRTDHGTDIPQELSDRLNRLDHRGPDHPHAVAMAPVENDTTVMGAKSNNFAIPGMQQRGKQMTSSSSEQTKNPPNESKNLIVDRSSLAETDDGTFVKSDAWVGEKSGMVFKYGSQGLGYYKDIPLTQLTGD